MSMDRAVNFQLPFRDSDLVAKTPELANYPFNSLFGILNAIKSVMVRAFRAFNSLFGIRYDLWLIRGATHKAFNSLFGIQAWEDALFEGRLACLSTPFSGFFE